MIIGDPNKANTTDSIFANFIEKNFLYVDKTAMIERFLDNSSDVQLVCRQRRIGKSLNMDMLYRFLTDSYDYRPLFEGLYIRSSPYWGKAHSAPAFLFDLKDITSPYYETIICEKIRAYAEQYADSPSCPKHIANEYSRWAEKPTTVGLLLLTKLAFAATGKKSYILIDEYDKLLMDIRGDHEKYNEIRDYLASFFSAGLKGNEYLEKALLTGVARISQEGLFSGLNNVEVYDVFDDERYAGDYGLTDTETEELSAACGFSLETAKEWYNGIKIGGRAITNTFSVMSMIAYKEFGSYWGSSGSLGPIAGLLTPDRKLAILSLLMPGTEIEVPVSDRLSPGQLFESASDREFYSILIQAGYLSLEAYNGRMARVAIPNRELREVWQGFIIARFFKGGAKAMQGIFDTGDLNALDVRLESYLEETLAGMSYHDLSKNDGSGKTPEGT